MTWEAISARPQEEETSELLAANASLREQVDGMDRHPSIHISGSP
jgi:hypothetical protein